MRWRPKPWQQGRGLAEVIAARGLGEAVDLVALAAAGRLALPITHPDLTHMHLTGTGLTHLGSAATRDAMHAKLDGAETLTDSMKMFQMGLADGRPAAGQVGVQPEWFYKGNGHTAVAPGAALTSPGFALDGGEEPELAGIYLIDADGTPARVGWALANEFSDHVTERINYLFLAHSKLREASFGPELLVGDLPMMCAAPAGFGATVRRFSTSRSCRARPTCRIRLRTWSITISNMPCSASPAICMCICLAPRRSALPKG